MKQSLKTLAVLALFTSLSFWTLVSPLYAGYGWYSYIPETTYSKGANDMSLIDDIWWMTPEGTNYKGPGVWIQLEGSYIYYNKSGTKQVGPNFSLQKMYVPLRYNKGGYYEGYCILNIPGPMFGMLYLRFKRYDKSNVGTTKYIYDQGSYGTPYEHISVSTSLGLLSDPDINFSLGGFGFKYPESETTGGRQMFNIYPSSFHNVP